MKRKKTAIVSGYFDPLHVGHLEYLRMASQLGDTLLVIVNNDEQAKLKNPFEVIEPNFYEYGNLKFWWNIVDKYLNEANELYGY